MRSRSRRGREVDLFNFSFLDILACVIGLLIFVLTIVVISGGGSSSSVAQQAVSAADHQFQEARSAAQAAAARRKQNELLLAQRANDVADESQDADTVRKQIAAIDNETQRLASQAWDAASRARSLANTLHGIPQGAADVAAEVSRIDAQTRILQQQFVEAKQKSVPQQISYYLPRVRETDRLSLWVEVSGGRLWALESDDYEQVPQDANGIRFDRRPCASGTSIDEIISRASRPPVAVDRASPAQTVIQIAVRPDGYEGFRKFRDWAWSKGFAVNWVPFGNEPIVLVPTSHIYQQ